MAWESRRQSDYTDYTVFKARQPGYVDHYVYHIFRSRSSSKTRIPQVSQIMQATDPPSQPECKLQIPQSQPEYANERSLKANWAMQIVDLSKPAWLYFFVCF